MVAVHSSCLGSANLLQQHCPSWDVEISSMSSDVGVLVMQCILVVQHKNLFCETLKHVQCCICCRHALGWQAMKEKTTTDLAWYMWSFRSATMYDSSK